MKTLFLKTKTAFSFSWGIRWLARQTWRLHGAFGIRHPFQVVGSSLEQSDGSIHCTESISKLKIMHTHTHIWHLTWRYSNSLYTAGHFDTHFWELTQTKPIDQERPLPSFQSVLACPHGGLQIWYSGVQAPPHLPNYISWLRAYKFASFGFMPGSYLSIGHKFFQSFCHSRPWIL